MGRIATRVRSALRSPGAARAFWVSLLAIHIPAGIAVGRSLTQGDASISMWSVLGLAATIAFFILKCFDVRCLRLRGRGTKIAFLLVCALVHRGVVTGPLVEQVIDSTPLIAAAGTVSLGASSGFRCRLRDAIKTLQRSLRHTPRLLRATAIDIARHTLPKIDVPMYRLRPPLRGPPRLRAVIDRSICRDG